MLVLGILLLWILHYITTLLPYPRYFILGIVSYLMRHLEDPTSRCCATVNKTGIVALLCNSWSRYCNKLPCHPPVGCFWSGCRTSIVLPTLPGISCFQHRENGKPSNIYYTLLIELDTMNILLNWVFVITGLANQLIINKQGSVYTTYNIVFTNLSILSTRRSSSENIKVFSLLSTF